MVAFVGDLEADEPWGQELIRVVRFQVAAGPAVQFNSELRARVLGYWSDATASVKISGSVGNSGYQALAEALAVALVCHSRSNGSESCRSKLELTLVDNFGPNAFSAVVRVPMGESLAVELLIGEESVASITAPVPEKVLGVERFI